ncbi:MAG: hypothetical protein P8X75_11180 [Limibacillus sp.]|jgi:Flp pilus assembly pilin Flp
MTARASGLALAPAFLSDERGATLIEYTILLSFVAAVGVAVVWPVAMKVESQFAALQTALVYTPSTVAPDHDTSNAITHQTVIGSIHNDHAVLSPGSGTGGSSGSGGGGTVAASSGSGSGGTGSTGGTGGSSLPTTSLSASFHNCGSGFWNAHAGKCVGRHH